MEGDKKMPAGLPDSIRREVIQKLLEGQSRDSIASECGISTGATSAIIAEFTRLVGTDLARQLRELSLGLKRMGISLAQCSKGFRIYEILDKLGVDENNLELFVTDLYDKSRRIGLGPQELCNYLLDLMNFSADCFRTVELEGQEGREVTVVPLISQIPDYIARKRTELKNIGQEIAEEKQEKSRLDGAIVEAREIHSKILAATETDRTNMEWLSMVKTEMKNVGLPIDEPTRLAKAAKWVQERGTISRRSYRHFQIIKDGF
jgi:hypothetical protein